MDTLKHNIYNFRQESITNALVIRDAEKITFCFLAVSKNETDEFYSNCGLAIFKSKKCWLSKYGYPNEDNLEDHPLYKKGLDGCGIVEVENSSWIAEMLEHERWKNFNKTRLKHYIIPFKESTLELICEDLEHEISQKDYKTVRNEMINWIEPY